MYEITKRRPIEGGAQLVEKPLGARGPQPPEAIIGFGDMRVKSAKSLA